LFDLEGYASVWHLVSTVCGELRPGPDAVDLLHLLPWQLGHRLPEDTSHGDHQGLEPIRRGVYCGAIGSLSFTGAMDTNIVIRTLVLGAVECTCRSAAR
jgi:para-aminobenzoate synthetase component I